MINLGLVQRSLRETLWTTLTLSAFLAAISTLMAYALPRVQARFMQRGIPPGIRQFRDALFGFDSSTAGAAEIAFSIAWSHPIVIAIVAAHAIILCTRTLAAEVERGTVDVLLALPVSRWTLHVSETVAWIISAAVLLASLLAGSYAGSRMLPDDLRPDFARLSVVLANLALVYAVVGTSAMVMGVITDRRVRAVLTVLVLTVFSVLISFLYTLDSSLEFTRRLRFLSILDYYKPIQTLMQAGWPWRDMTVLAAASLTAWIAAGLVLARRDVTST